MSDAIGTHFGPFRIAGLLGRGAVGSVYRAEDSRDGSVVAVKTLERPLPAFLPTLRREIAALARLEHPGIVRILESGSLDGVPWYAMELIEGPNLLDHCRDLPLPEALRVIRRLCMALAYLHGEGLIHRDLKPDNILTRTMREQSRKSGPLRGQPNSLEAHRARLSTSVVPVLVDFGLAASTGSELSREAIDQDLGASGTLLYMPPEQLRGELCDARADLYSLGCILYELLSGRPPFQSEHAAELVQGHLYGSVAPLPQTDPPRPAALDALVLQLLAKSPSERLGHAEDVAAALAPFAAPDEQVWQRPRAYLYRPAMSGRAAPLQQLEARLDRLQSGHGAVVFLGGESGVGKSRLALELAQRAERRRVRVLGGECQPRIAGESLAAEGPNGTRPQFAVPGGPLHPLRRSLQAVADRCRGRGKAETARLLGRNAMLLGLYEPALHALGHEASGDPLAQALPLPPEAARRLLFEALTHTFCALAELGPLLLLLDDLHWSDELTLGWLEHLLKTARLDRTRFLIVATYRIEEKHEALERLLDLERAVAMRLERLDEESVGGIVADMLALWPPPPDFVRFLALHSEGNPFFVAEYLRAAVAEGILSRDSAGHWQLGSPDATRDSSHHGAEARRYEALPFPRSLHATVSRRLDSLSPEGQSLACKAAVLGRDLEQALLLDVADVPESRAWAPLEELRVREIIEEAAPGRLRFAHDKLREVAYGRLGAPERALLHRRAAEALEVRRKGGHAEDLALLGDHWERAGAAEPARTSYLEAARQATSRYAIADAVELYRACLRLHEKPASETVLAQIEMSEGILRLGRVPEAMEQMRAAVREAGGIADRRAEVLSLLKLAQFCLLSGGLDEPETHARQAAILASSLGDGALECDALLALGRVCRGRGQIEEARLYAERAASLAQQSGQVRKRIAALHQLGETLRYQGRFAEAQALGEEALKIADDIGLKHVQAASLLVLGSIHFDRGDLAEAARHYQQSLERARESDQPYLEQTNLKNLGDVRHAEGQLDEARSHYEQALDLARRLEFHSSEVLLLSDLADLHALGGRVVEAYALYEQSLVLSRSLGRHGDEATTLLRRARVARRIGELSVSETLLAQVEALLGPVAAALLKVFHGCERAHLALARGRLEEAAAGLDEVQSMVERSRCRPDSVMGRDLACLQRAVTAAKAGQRLFNGECDRDVPAGLQQWLREQAEHQPSH